MKVMPPIFYEKRMIFKFTYIMGWDFSPPTKSLHYQHIFPPLLETLHALYIKLCWRVRALHVCSISSAHAPPHKSSECIFQGAKEMEVGGSKMGRMRASFIFQFGRNLQVCCMNLLVYMYRSEWIVALLFKNSTNISTLSQEMLATTLLTEGCILNFFSLILCSCQMSARWAWRFHATGLT